MSQEIPDSTSNGGVSRRAVILGAIGAGVSAAMSVALPEPAVAASSSLTLTPLAHDMIGTPSGQVTEVPAFLGGLLTVAGSDVPARSVLTVTWDHRLFHLRDRPRLTDKAGAIVPCELRGKPSTTSTGMGQVSVIVTAPLRRGKEYVLNLGTGRSRRYPHDLIVDPHVGALTLGQAKTVEKPTAVPLRPAAGGGVWGAVIGAGWQPVTWGKRFHSWLPQLVTVRSVGPDPIPAGTVVEVQVDNRLASSIRLHVLDGSYGDSATRELNGALHTTLSLSEPVPAEQRLSFAVNAAPTSPNDTLPGFQPPMVQIRAETFAPGQRITGQESLTRQDNAVDAPGVKTYGELTVA